ncbi:MAG TPA: GGDEF domain-containing protein [Candidatus Paceibacterota bacterium]|nr:GGDEF domain-containing protein [Candidatus Paceibacterota bacterium]
MDISVSPGMNHSRCSQTEARLRKRLNKLAARTREQAAIIQQQKAKIVQLQNENTRLQYDEKTGLLTYEGLLNRVSQTPLSRGVFCVLDLNGLKVFNDRSWNYDEGNVAIEWFAGYLKMNIRKTDIARKHTTGDEFIVILKGVSIEGAEDRMQDLRHGFIELSRKHKLFIKYNVKPGFSYGMVAYTKLTNENIEDLFKIAVQNMYRQKAAYKK